jgi:hypothetical protein
LPGNFIGLSLALKYFLATRFDIGATAQQSAQRLGAGDDDGWCFSKS